MFIINHDLGLFVNNFFNSHDRKVATYMRQMPRARPPQMFRTPLQRGLQTGVTLTATDGRKRRLELRCVPMFRNNHISWIGLLVLFVNIYVNVPTNTSNVPAQPRT